MPQYYKTVKEKLILNPKSKAGRKGGVIGGFRSRLYSFGKTAGDINAVVQSQFVKNARRNAYSAARVGGFASALSNKGEFKAKYGSAQSLALRAGRVGIGRMSGIWSSCKKRVRFLYF
jgi:hypothetical protein